MELQVIADGIGVDPKHAARTGQEKVLIQVANGSRTTANRDQGRRVSQASLDAEMRPQPCRHARREYRTAYGFLLESCLFTKLLRCFHQAAAVGHVEPD